MVGTFSNYFMVKTFLYITIFTIISSCLISGVFLAFSDFVIRGLNRIPTKDAIAAMQSINVTVLNSIFITLFILTAICCLILAVLGIKIYGVSGSAFILAGCFFYLVGSFLVTMLFNVPLNESLKAATIPDQAAATEVWQHYMSSWIFWNHVRTIFSALASVSFLFGLFRIGVTMEDLVK